MCIVPGTCSCGGNVVSVSHPVTTRWISWILHPRAISVANINISSHHQPTNNNNHYSLHYYICGSYYNIDKISIYWYFVTGGGIVPLHFSLSVFIFVLLYWVVLPLYSVLECSKRCSQCIINIFIIIPKTYVCGIIELKAAYFLHFVFTLFYCIARHNTPRLFLLFQVVVLVL